MPGSSKLSSLQSELLDAFFARDQRFFLTGGAALVGYYLFHRRGSTPRPLLAEARAASDDGAGMPFFVERELRADLDCGHETPPGFNPLCGLDRD